MLGSIKNIPFLAFTPGVLGHFSIDTIDFILVTTLLLLTENNESID